MGCICSDELVSMTTRLQGKSHLVETLVAVLMITAVSEPPTRISTIDHDPSPQIAQHHRAQPVYVQHVATPMQKDHVEYDDT